MEIDESQICGCVLGAGLYLVLVMKGKPLYLTPGLRAPSRRYCANKTIFIIFVMLLTELLQKQITKPLDLPRLGLTYGIYALNLNILVHLQSSELHLVSSTDFYISTQKQNNQVHTIQLNNRTYIYQFIILSRYFLYQRSIILRNRDYLYQFHSLTNFLSYK